MTITGIFTVRVLPHYRVVEELGSGGMGRFTAPVTNIEKIYEFGGDAGVDFLVTEYIPGSTLSDRIRSGPMPETEIRQIAAQIAAALFLLTTKLNCIARNPRRLACSSECEHIALATPLPDAVPAVMYPQFATCEPPLRWLGRR
jgi:serine/threonine protein kinase